MKTHYVPQPPTPRNPGDDAPPGSAPPVPVAQSADDPPATATQGQEAEMLLERTRALVDPRLRAAVESLPGSIRRVAMYHFGWQEADGSPSSGPAGKAIRPALVLAAARALGGDQEQAVRAAVAVELAHNFTLLHDDVIDEDRTRRHRPTAWAVFGIPDAVIAGDAMLALAQRLLAEDSSPAGARASARLSTCVIELCAGQQADCAFEDRGPDEVTLDECLTMATAKTGALLGCACALGALYAGAGSGRSARWTDSAGRRASPSSSSTT